MDQQNNCIVISHVDKYYGKKQALKDINLTIEQGMFGLLGRNGAGKTTLMKTLATLHEKQAGEISVCGIPVSHAREIRAITGYLPQDFSMYGNMSAYEALDYLAVLSGMSRAERIRKVPEMLAVVNLTEKRRTKVKSMSGGMKRRLGIAQAIIHDPKVIIVDEPTAGLDPVVRDEILDEFLAFVSDEDHAILISSHITSDLEKVADYIAYLHQGKLLLCDEKDRLLESYGRLVCTREELAQVDRGYVVATRRSQYSTEALIRRRGDFKRLYPRLTVEPVTLDELMVFVVKGEKA